MFYKKIYKNRWLVISLFLCIDPIHAAVTIGMQQINSDEISVQTDSNSTTVSQDHTKADDAHVVDVEMTGIKETIPLNGKVKTISVPAAIAHIIVSDDASYIECDKAVFSSGLKFSLKNGKLGLELAQYHNSITFQGATTQKPLCTIVANIMETALRVEGVSDVTVKAPDVQDLKASGCSRVAVDNPKDLRSVDVNGCAVIAISNLYNRMFHATLSGSAKVTVDGKVDEQVVDATGNSSYDASNFVSNIARINLSGMSFARLWVNHNLYGSASGMSKAKYSGDANNQVETSGMSSCRKV